VALVTGSSRGIGSGIARCLAAAGADVVVNGRRETDAARQRTGELEAEIRAFGQTAHTVFADISAREGRQRLLGDVRDRFGRLDHLVLNAARSPFKPLERLLERDLRQLVDTNFIANISCVREALPLIEAESGSIVFISSLGGRTTLPAYPLGSMKAAMETAVRDLDASLVERGVRVNAVCGGLVRTDAIKTLRQHWPGIDELPERWFVTVDEIAQTVVFLCSERARGIRGQTVVVDRGLGNRLQLAPRPQPGSL
jgi:NAD(P)-dependent dehydrogenase (short-subunit alcohol dehydrogenase family)